MKRILILAAMGGLFAACSSSSSGTDGGSSTSGGSTSGGSTSTTGSSSGGSTSGGSSSASGGITITISPVGVHPAAVAALQTLGLTPPSLASGYTLLVQGVSLGAGGSAKLNVLGSKALDTSNDTGPIVFPNISADSSNATLGVISAIVSDASLDAGAATPIDWPACGASGAFATGSSADGGSYVMDVDGGVFVDSFVPAGNQIVASVPSSNVTGPAYAMPASYLALLDCAAGQPPGTFLKNGLAVAYTSSSQYGQGSALSGVTLQASNGTVAYFDSSYKTTNAAGPTSANGVGIVTGVSLLGSLSATDAAGDSFKNKEIATPGDSAYQVFFAPGY